MTPALLNRYSTAENIFTKHSPAQGPDFHREGPGVTAP